MQQKLILTQNKINMKNSSTEPFDTANSNAMLSAVEILNKKYDEMQIIADEYYLGLLKNCFDKNSRNIFDKIISGMGTLAFYKKGEPLFKQEKIEIKYLEEINDFLNKWDEILGLTGDYIIVNKDGISVNQ